MGRIIFISGKAESGKDSVAKMLKKKFEENGRKTLIIHLADYLKFICKEYLDWNGEKDEKGRSLLQYEGTEFVRSKDIDFWTKVIKNFIEIYKNRFDFFIIPDTRFPGEIELFKGDRFPVMTVRVERPEYESSLTEEQKNHVSETALDNYKFDFTISSSSGLDNLQLAVNEFLEFMDLLY